MNTWQDKLRDFFLRHYIIKRIVVIGLIPLWIVCYILDSLSDFKFKDMAKEYANTFYEIWNECK